MLKRKKGGLKKALALGLIGIATFTGALGFSNKIEASAHNAYFLSITIDEGNFRYVPTVVYEDNSFVANNHRETDLGSFVNDGVKDGNFSVPDNIDYSKVQDEDAMKKEYPMVKAGDGDEDLLFTFPPLHGRGWMTDKVHATGQDEALANKVVDTACNGLNDALSFMKGQVSQNIPVDTWKKKSAELANKAVNKSGSVEIGGVTFSLSSGDPKVPMRGTTADDYVKISSPKGSSNFVFRTVKGYRQVGSDRLRSGLSKDYKEKVDDKDVKYLDWRDIVLQGNYNMDVKSISFSSVATITKPNMIEETVCSLLNGLLSGVRTLLGLYSLPDLMLNHGARSNSYYYGIMPNSWMGSATLLFIICQVIAWTCLGFSLTRLLFKRQLSTINVGEKISVMDGAKNIILTAFLLGAFPLIFNALVRMNYVLVNLFGKASAFSNTIGSTDTIITSGSIATIIIGFAFLALQIYFNFVYILRGITVAILYGISPLCIFALSLGGKFNQIFNNFLKEMISNIYLQSFHAILVAFFTSVTATTNMRTFEAITVLFAFIPLTSFIRQNLFGLSSGITDTASSMVATGTAVAGSALGAFAGAKAGSSGGGHSSGSKGNSSNPVMTDTLRNRTIPSGTGSDGGINNEELLGSIDGLSNKSNGSKSVFQDKSIPNSKGGKFASNLANSVGNKAFDNWSNDKGHTLGRGVDKFGKYADMSGKIGKTALNAGLVMGAVGLGAMGDAKGAGHLARTGVNGLSNNIRGGSSFGGNSDVDTIKADTGMNELYDGGEHMTAVYNTSFGEDGNMQFDDGVLDSSTYGTNMKDMYNAFASQGDYAEGGSKAHLRDDAVARYKSQGINGVGTYKGRDGKERLAVNFDKNLTNKGSFSFRNLGEIPPYVEKNKSQKPKATKITPSDMNA